jgi:hypothetical protein
MCRKLAKELQEDLLEYTKRFVIVEMTSEARVVSRRLVLIEITFSSFYLDDVSVLIVHHSTENH